MKKTASGTKSKAEKLETATFGAGCFWGVEEAFAEIKGVKETQVGFMGGNVKNPPYLLVCTGVTGHAEVVQVKYDPKEVSYEKLLDAFWEIHDPTQFNRQGPDVGTQYRSVIFYHSPEQKKLAEKLKKNLEKSGKYSQPTATAILPAKTFYRAEEYHQKYLQKRGLKTC